MSDFCRVHKEVMHIFSIQFSYNFAASPSAWSNSLNNVLFYVQSWGLLSLARCDTCPSHLSATLVLVFVLVSILHFKSQTQQKAPLMTVKTHLTFCMKDTQLILPLFGININNNNNINNSKCQENGNCFRSIWGQAVNRLKNSETDSWYYWTNLIELCACLTPISLTCTKPHLFLRQYFSL